MDDLDAAFAKRGPGPAGGRGPLMTVEEVYAPIFQYRYRCVWVEPYGSTQHKLFRTEQLERLPADPA